MLLPIGDDNQNRRTTPYVVYIILVINIVMFVFFQQAVMTPEGQHFTNGYAVVPYEITNGIDLTEPMIVRPSGSDIGSRSGQRPIQIPEAPGPSPIYLTLLTAMFMHGSWLHIAGNMLYLWIFGDNVEDNFGHGSFLLFYIICGLAASFAQIFVDPVSPIPSLGASGAIAGVLGSYLIMFPRNRIRTILPFGFVFLFTPIELPAVVVLGFWIVLQIFEQARSVAGEAQGGVAYMAHIGGFAVGAVLCFLFRRRNNSETRYDYR